MPTCWIMAGPNGAGKTTFAVNYLPQLADCFHFINADLIAAGLNSLAPEKELIGASRIFLSEIKEAVHKREDFAFETTLSGRTHLRLDQLRHLQTMRSRKSRSRRTHYPRSRYHTPIPQKSRKPVWSVW